LLLRFSNPAPASVWLHPRGAAVLSPCSSWRPLSSTLQIEGCYTHFRGTRGTQFWTPSPGSGKVRFAHYSQRGSLRIEYLSGVPTPCDGDSCRKQPIHH